MNKEERAVYAMNHKKEMEERYADEIQKSIKESDIYEKEVKLSPMKKGQMTISVVDSDSVSAVLSSNKKQCVLNFASFKHPGGGYSRGSTTQEEALCYESFLYNVISSDKFKSFYRENNRNINNSLYFDRAIYSPNIIFERGNKKALSDVITCACPNWCGAKATGVTSEENEDALRERIRFILKIVSKYNVERLILGAFGCGVFKQNPKVVAKIFHQELNDLYNNSNIEIEFAITKSEHNFNVFRKEFSK